MAAVATLDMAAAPSMAGADTAVIPVIVAPGVTEAIGEVMAVTGEAMAATIGTATGTTVIRGAMVTGRTRTIPGLASASVCIHPGEQITTLLRAPIIPILSAATWC